MRRISLRLCCTIKVLAIVLAMSNLSPAQHRNKRETDAKQTVLRQLHPEPPETDPPKNISLLAGYKHKGSTDFEGNIVGEISSNDQGGSR
jgi:hypothetical protein